MKTISRIFLFGAILLTMTAGQVVSGDPRPPAAHQQAQCSTCHSLRADISSSGNRSDDLARPCRQCHPEQASPTVAEPSRFHDRADRKCPDCHSFHEPAMLNAAGQSFRMDYQNQGLRFACKACHNAQGPLTGLSDGHRQAAALYHSDLLLLTAMSPSDRCLICHSNRSTPLPIPETVLNPPRFSEHASHPNGIPVQGGQYTSGGRIRFEIDSSIILNDGKIECQTCHCLTISNEDSAVADLSGSELACLGCHGRN